MTRDQGDIWARHTTSCALLCTALLLSGCLGSGGTQPSPVSAAGTSVPNVSRAADMRKPGFYPGQDYESASLLFQDSYQRYMRENAADIAKVRAFEVSDGPSPECIRRTAHECIAALSRVLVVSDSDNGRLISLPEPDIYGNPSSESYVVLLRAYVVDDLMYRPRSSSTHASSGLPNVGLLMDSKTNLVSAININLPENPILAKTEAEYADTGIASYLRAVLPDACDFDAPISAYRFVAEQLAPTGSTDGTQVYASASHASVSDNYGWRAGYCGFRIDITESRRTSLAGYNRNISLWIEAE